MERNTDKIKRLEHELGRYQKKVADQKKEISKLECLAGGMNEFMAAKNACDAMLAICYGEEIEGGYRLSTPAVNVEEMNDKWCVQTSVLESGEWETRVTRREEKTDGGESNDH